MTRLREHFRRWVSDIETGKITMLGFLWGPEYPGDGGEER
jgi:hypothetical protein